jgi:hypothetical protein
MDAADPESWSSTLLPKQLRGSFAYPDAAEAFPEFVWKKEWEAGKIPHPRPSLETVAGDSAFLSTLNRAYQSMRRDDTEAGLKAQAALHYVYCKGSATSNVHNFGAGLFLAWHRAFLFFHERLIRSHLRTVPGVSADAVRAFRLPYWNLRDFRKDVGSRAYSRGSLDDCTRTLDPNGIDRTTFCDLQNALTVTEISKACSRIYAWHAIAHSWVGGNMGSIPKAAYDPIFYTLHAFVDFVWTKIKAPTECISDPWFVFFDASQGWVKANLNDFRALGKLNYFYDGEMYPPPTDCSSHPALEISNLPAMHMAASPYRVVVQEWWGDRTVAHIPVLMEHMHSAEPASIRVDSRMAKEILDGKRHVTLKDRNGAEIPAMLTFALPALH